MGNLEISQCNFLFQEAWGTAREEAPFYRLTSHKSSCVLENDRMAVRNEITDTSNTHSQVQRAPVSHQKIPRMFCSFAYPYPILYVWGPQPSIRSGEIWVVDQIGWAENVEIILHRRLHSALFSPCGFDIATKARLGQTDLSIVLVVQVNLLCYFSVCLHAHHPGTSWE